MRLIYTLLTYFLAPLIPFYLRKRGRANPEYLKHWDERFALKLRKPSQRPIIWLHSVSVGETRAMQKLVNLITEQLPNYQVLITTMTPTGRATAQSLYPHVHIHYIPYDLAHCVKRFYQTFQPQLGIIFETEIWPNLIHYGARMGVKLYLANARLSQRSYRGYRRFKWFIGPLLNQLTAILSQDATSADHFKLLGYQGLLTIEGNTKFDLVLPPALLTTIDHFKQIFAGRRVIILASTRDGEEELLLDNLDLSQEVIYLIVPRHPERFPLVANLLTARQINFQRRSQLSELAPTTKVVLGDSMGELLAYYAISHLAVIGGSFSDCGGQNPIEAIFMQVPVIFGSSMYNFKQVAADCVGDGCAIQLSSVATLAPTLHNLLNDQSAYQHLQVNCQKFIDRYQGASARIFTHIRQALPN